MNSVRQLPHDYLDKYLTESVPVEIKERGCPSPFGDFKQMRYYVTKVHTIS
jgi:hypothetical protein